MFNAARYPIIQNCLKAGRSSLAGALLHQNTLLTSPTTNVLSLGYTLKRYQSKLSQIKNGTGTVTLADNKLCEKDKPHNGKNENVTAEDKKYKTPVDPAFKGSHQEDYQRIIKYTLIPLTLVPFYTSFTGMTLNPIFDVSLSSLYLWYLHYGFSSLIISKIPKRKYPMANKVSMWSLYTATFLSLCGIYQLETENNGLVNLITRLWNDDESNIYVFGR